MQNSRLTVRGDVVTVPTRQGLEAVDILRRHHFEAVGPVLHDDRGETLGFVVPTGTAEAWNVPGSRCVHRVEGTDWLLPPAREGLATDPAVLRRALREAARLIAAADSCE
ncbi:hypothetical protein [Streptomyces abyssomicinicus]|uniref:hypothetical protein n=1 Tax=Streptomyces abyssomicinicus TaxID=574929 RepID=UPI0012501B9E|nr:hypothetical protein [Streptomyces abyssomicinicus]